MENNNEIIINNTTETINNNEIKKKTKKVVSEAQKRASQKYYLKVKSNPDYMERSRISSKKHYDNHKEEVLERIKKYQKDKLELSMIERLYELQQEGLIDVHTGDMTDEQYNILEQKMIDKLAHLHLVS